jgi:hypothetical protein
MHLPGCMFVICLKPEWLLWADDKHTCIVPVKVVEEFRRA